MHGADMKRRRQRFRHVIAMPSRDRDAVAHTLPAGAPGARSSLRRVSACNFSKADLAFLKPPLLRDKNFSVLIAFHLVAHFPRVFLKIPTS